MAESIGKLFFLVTEFITKDNPTGLYSLLISLLFYKSYEFEYKPEKLSICAVYFNTTMEGFERKYLAAASVRQRTCNFS